MRFKNNLLKLLLILFMILSFTSLKFSNAQERNIAQIGVVGVMPDEYIGSFTLEWANTVESDLSQNYHSNAGYEI